MTEDGRGFAALQISAEQILLEAYERRDLPVKTGPKKAADLEELHDFQAHKRREFEDALTRKRSDIAQWQRYARFELENKEFERARSIFERALAVDSTDASLWMAYIRAELRNRNINHARNLLNRALSRLPMSSKLWYTYAAIEEALSNVNGCRDVFERWVSWDPPMSAWMAYVNMEKRQGNYENARALLNRLAEKFPEVDTWIEWAKFEEEHGSAVSTRIVYQNAAQSLSIEEFKPSYERLVVQWIRWEIKQSELERARHIFHLFLRRLPAARSKILRTEFSRFEKQYGSSEGVYSVVAEERRRHYENVLKDNERSYSGWLAYSQLLEETSAPINQRRALFERAVRNVPKSRRKCHWREYIHLWIAYALFEELDGNRDRAAEVYRQCLKLIPHKHFTFGKVWILYAKYQIRSGSIAGARKTLGRAIGMTSKSSIFRSYIEIEKRMREFDRCRGLYQKFIEEHPESSEAWLGYSSMEEELGDIDRARGLLNLATSQPRVDHPELLWRQYISLELAEANLDAARSLFERVLQEKPTYEVWISYAMMELGLQTEPNITTNGHPEATQIQRARNVFKRAWSSMEGDIATNRFALLEAWISFEHEYGDAATLAEAKNLEPTAVTKRRKTAEGAFEEFDELTFSSSSTAAPTGLSKLLTNAQKWKQQLQN